ncbi:hypothetical protein [Pseudogemmobacter bohemicus]|uniref:hypothetical protein n=1 Tax=Pseudogemmobacter bohemicus TaxID=2250708 RepID=UPI000DD338DB|nr:hypothetical protein [Pseudogemmobacter bohemicus]
MTGPWHLNAPSDHATADAVQLLLRRRGLPVERGSAGPLSVLVPPGQLPVALQDGAALTHAVPGNGAENLAAFTAAIAALDHLSVLDPSAFPARLDLTIYALRQHLRPLEALAAPDCPESDASLIMAPLLWRIALLDRHFALFLLSGLPGLAALQEAQAGLPQIASLLHPGAALHFLHHVGRHTGRKPSGSPETDWSRALGPEGREKSLFPRGQRRKDPSIGSGDHIR